MEALSTDSPCGIIIAQYKVNSMILCIVFTVLLIVIILTLSKMIHIKSQWKELNNYLNSITKTVNSVRYGNLTAKVVPYNNKNYQNLTDSINRMIEALNDREHMIYEYQNEMIKQNELLESIVNSLSDGIVIVDEKLKIINTTPKIKKWFECENPEGKFLHEFMDIQNTDKIKNLNQENISIKQSPATKFLISSQTLKTNEQNLYILVIKDVTKDHEIEALKEDFVATLTHDLKVPIVAESNIIDFLLDGKFGETNDKQKIALKNIQSSNHELLELVQIVLETYKIKDKGIQLLKENFNLNNFIQSIIEEMLPIANQANITINYQPSQNIDINADIMQMTRVIKNLISNAISHSNTKEKIDIITKQENNKTFISVIDYGQGISKEELPLIFNKYYSATNKFRKIGTGLGLYLSKQIILSHGGDITVNSEENVKTEFCITLPH